MNHKTFTLVGAGLGLVTFLVVGLLPAVLYGGYAGLLLARGLGASPGFLLNVFIVGGMVFGVTAVASLFAVLGAAAGAGLSVVADPTTSVGYRTP